MPLVIYFRFVCKSYILRFLNVSVELCGFKTQNVLGELSEKIRILGVHIFAWVKSQIAWVKSILFGLYLLGDGEKTQKISAKLEL